MNVATESGMAFAHALHVDSTSSRPRAVRPVPYSLYTTFGTRMLRYLSKFFSLYARSEAFATSVTLSTDGCGILFPPESVPFVRVNARKAGGPAAQEGCRPYQD